MDIVLLLMYKSTDEVMCPDPVCSEIARNLDLLLGLLNPLYKSPGPDPSGQATLHEGTRNISMFPFTTSPSSHHHELFVPSPSSGSARPTHPVHRASLVSLTGPILPVRYLILRPTPELTRRAWPNLMRLKYIFPRLQVQTRWHILSPNLACCVHIKYTSSKTSHD